MQLTASEQLLYSTVRIECDYNNGIQGTGTGFFFQFLKESSGQHIPVIITNKHVINAATQIKFTFTKANSNNEPLDTQHFTVGCDNLVYRQHPDESVDLCAIPIATILTESSKRNENAFYISLDKSLLPTQEQIENFSALEEILMIGYPNGIWDHVNNKPVLRRGITATHPKYDYCGKKELMIDAACFPGSSGSPVFIFNENGWQDRKGNFTAGSIRIILLGILYAGPQHMVNGDIGIINVPTQNKAIAISRIPNNLGCIIKSERIIELEDLFKSSSK